MGISQLQEHHVKHDHFLNLAQEIGTPARVPQYMHRLHIPAVCHI